MVTAGIIFDIQRCSLRDGPGIRTTVFLKGCPLRCVWCHNPEAISPQPELGFRADKCTQCQTCLQVCTHNVHSFSDGKHLLDRSACQTCGDCVASCLQNALQIIGRSMTAEEVLAEVERDRAYYDHSGGGVTLSGGEPMRQFNFSLGLLRLSRERGLHTCLETSGYAPQEQYHQLLPLVDLFLFDIKATDPAKHKALTGVPNARILSNLDFLLGAGSQVILRCPLVPGVNDDPGHLQGIAALAKRYPGLAGVELMAYHDMGRDKAAQVGREPALVGVRTADEEVKQSWLSALAGLGCQAKFG